MTEYAPTDVTVVICTFDRWTVLQRTLEALRNQTVSGFDILVVVDGSTDEPPDLGVPMLVLPHQGLAAARNAGARAMQRRILLFLDDDMVPVPEHIERHLAVHNRHPEPEVAVLGHVDIHPEVIGNRINRWMDWSGTQFEFHNIVGEEAGAGRSYFCNTSLKRDFFLAGGGFDESFIVYYEDIECGWRLHQRGMRLLYARDAVTQHFHPLGWPQLIRRFQGVARGERLMAAKYDWFEPFFAKRVWRAQRGRRPSRLWPLVVDRLPRALGLRSLAKRKANDWYYRRVGPYFLDAAEGERDLDELRLYLGEDFDQHRLEGHASGVVHELESAPDEDTFYRTSETYLYDLTVFAMSGTKVPYLQELKRLVAPPARVLDYGCGIGSDGLRLLPSGYEVEFADFDNPSTRFLRWRLEQRGLESKVYDIDSDAIPGGYDAAYALDVIEHVDDPFAFLAELEKRAGVVIVNLLEEEADPMHPHHRDLPIRKIIDHASERGLLAYRIYHGRSHFIAYRGTSTRKVGDSLRRIVQRRLGPYAPALRGDEGPGRFLSIPAGHNH